MKEMETTRSKIISMENSLNAFVMMDAINLVNGPGASNSNHTKETHLTKRQKIGCTEGEIFLGASGAMRLIVLHRWM